MEIEYRARTLEREWSEWLPAEKDEFKRTVVHGLFQTGNLARAHLTFWTGLEMEIRVKVEET